MFCSLWDGENGIVCCLSACLLFSDPAHYSVWNCLLWITSWIQNISEGRPFYWTIETRKFQNTCRHTTATSFSICKCWNFDLFKPPNSDFIFSVFSCITLCHSNFEWNVRQVFNKLLQYFQKIAFFKNFFKKWLKHNRFLHELVLQCNQSIFQKLKLFCGIESLCFD